MPSTRSYFRVDIFGVDPVQRSVAGNLVVVIYQYDVVELEMGLQEQ